MNLLILNTQKLRYAYLSFFVLMGCNKLVKEIKNAGDDPNLFTIRTSEDTGIDFKNSIVENANLNGILYEYLYNGGGVALADFNGDGLSDLYFISNLNSNKLYLNSGGLKFKDITKTSNTKGNNGYSTGVTVVDINSDGKLDIYICKSGKYNNPDDRRNELLINKGNNKDGIPIFEEKGKDYGLDLPHYSTQAAFFDYDRDNDLDMFLINHGTQPYEDEMIDSLQKTSAPFQSSRLFKNEKGFYKDVSAISGIIDNGLSFGLGIAIGDLNNDGWPDILVGNDFSEKDYLYLNKRNGKFEEVIKKAAKHISYFSMGNDIADINNDGWLDFITLDMMSEHNYDIKTSMSGMNPEKFYDLTKKGLHHQYMYNALQLNNGILNEKEGVPVFSDIAQISNVSNTDWSWGPLLFDMDNDGWKDLFISNGIKKDFRNNDFLKYKQKRFDAFFAANGEQTPQNKQKARALISELVGEMPNRSKPNYFFKNKNGQGYEKKNNLWAKDIATNSNGAVYGDLDNDGDLDIVVNNMDNLAFIYENTARNNETGNFFKVKLRGPKGNLNAVGARVKIVYGKNKQVQEFYPTRGFQSASSTNIHFGLSSLEEIDELTVSWPDGKQSSYKNLKVNQLFEADYLSAKNDTSLADKENLYFKDITIEKSLSFLHQENDYDDFKRESLLPHKLSQTGPALAIGDIDDNGLDDIYIGGAKAQAGKIFLQNEKGNFIEHTQPAFHSDSNFEDTGALFFDADNDGDLDLYVVSGGNEEEHNSEGLNDRLYENINGGFNRILTIPSLKTSGSCVKASDFDQDGDLDLFIGGRQKPGNYPEPVNSFILQNHSTTGSIKFVDVTKKVAPSLLNVGMVTDAIWFNSNGDEYPDLFIVGEWMSPRILQNEHGNFMDVTERTKLENQTGWWFSVASSDIDGDGDEDIIAGNLGMNYKYNASEKEPFEIYQKDFDSNGTKDIVLGYYDLGNLYPLRGRECSSNQVPTIKEKFATYHQFAEATLMDVYGQPNLNNALHYSANTFATSYFENKGDGTFQVHPLKFSSQISSVNTININDFDNDGNLDIVIAGNWYVSEVETPRNDASYGLFLKGDGKGNFEEVPAYQSGLYIDGDVRKAQLITTPNKGKALVIAKNNDLLQLIDIQ